MARFRNALVVGKFAPLHRGHQLVIDRAFSIADAVTIVTWSNPDFPAMDNGVRANWLRTLYPSAQVLVGADGPHESEPDHVQQEYTHALCVANGAFIDVVVSSEHYGEPLARWFDASHELVDPARVAAPISGTALREDVHANRAMLDPRVYSHFVSRVVLMGAESTGKSTLAAALAASFDTGFVSEYGRVHYEERGGLLDLDDYVTIAERQRELEDAAVLRANRFLFCDTNAVTTMFFSHYYNGGSLPALRALAGECKDRYAHVLVCDTDIPFEQDGWRDNAVWRQRMQGMVLHDLAVREIPYVTISGTLAERVSAVRTLLLEGVAPFDGGGPAAAEPAGHASIGPRPS